MSSSRKPRKRQTPFQPQLPNSSRVQSDNIKLLNIFPDIVWILILQKLAHNPSSLQAIVNSSLVLRYFFKTSNYFACHMFPLVWPSFFNRVQRQQYGRNFKRYYGAMLKCRNVCQNWCGSIARYFQDHPDRFPKVDSHFDCKPVQKGQILEYLSPNMKLSNSFNEYSEEKLLKFLPHFHTTHAPSFRSPFISGEVSFRFQNRPTDRLQAQLLEFYGHHVLHCTLEIAITHGTYARLVHTLQHMPNLKTLRITCLGFDYVHDWIISQYNFPWLLNLLSLKLEKVSEAILVDMLVRHSPNLRYLEFGESDFYKPLPFPPCRCTKLNNLKVSINKSGSVWLLDTVHQVESVEVYFNWQLEWPLFHVLEMLEAKLPDTCKTLAIFAGKVGMQEASQFCRLRLKRVEMFALYLNNYVPIDFVLGMRHTLRFLHVRFSGMNTNYQSWRAEPWANRIMESEQVKFLSCWGNLNHSNIWELFPMLEVLKVGDYVQDGVMGTNLEVTCWIKGKRSFEKRFWLVDGYQRAGKVTKMEVPF